VVDVPAKPRSTSSSTVASSSRARIARVRSSCGTRGAAPGWGSCLGRWFLHGLINQAVYLDYLWPLWDKPKVQTLTDKILSTVVVKRA
jgi:hypothetical protein